MSTRLPQHKSLCHQQALTSRQSRESEREIERERETLVLKVEKREQRAKEETEGKTSKQRERDREGGSESQQGRCFSQIAVEAREARCETIGATGGETGGGYCGWAVPDRDRRCESGPETEH